MTGVLAIVGDVTAKQYQSTLDELKASGHKAVIRRFEDPQKLLLAERMALRQLGKKRDRESFNVDAENELKLAIDRLFGLDTDQLFGIIFSEEAFRQYDKFRPLGAHKIVDLDGFDRCFPEIISIAMVDHGGSLTPVL